MNRLDKVQGIIFDMDGTLVDSMKMWESVASDYLKLKGYVPEDDLDEKIKNMSLLQGVEYVIKAHSMKETTKEILQGIHNSVAKKYEEEIKAKEGALELIQALAKKKIAMCVATASDYNWAKSCLERVGILPYLRGVYSCVEIGIGKEDPMLFEYVGEKLGTKKEETLVVEDTVYALETAKRAGFRVIAVYDESSKADQKKLMEKADLYVTTMKELL